jgi:hypothetical protein
MGSFPPRSAAGSLHVTSRSDTVAYHEVAGIYHLIVSVFDAKTGKRIENATVSARVGELALAPQSKMLEPMQIAGTVTFGNFFTISRPHGGTPHKLYSSTATCGDKAGTI